MTARSGIPPPRSGDARPSTSVASPTAVRSVKAGSGEIRGAWGTTRLPSPGRERGLPPVTHLQAQLTEREQSRRRPVSVSAQAAVHDAAAAPLPQLLRRSTIPSWLDGHLSYLTSLPGRHLIDLTIRFRGSACGKRMAPAMGAPIPAGRVAVLATRRTPRVSPGPRSFRPPSTDHNLADASAASLPGPYARRRRSTHRRQRRSESTRGRLAGDAPRRRLAPLESRAPR